MKENLKRYIGLLLAVIMVVSMVPASAVPALADTYTSNVIGPLQLEEEEVDFGEPDPSAGLESEGDFVASLHEVALKGLPYNQRLLAVAETQLGYTESDLNFVVKEDEATGKKAKYGITRYGQWYGLPYEDWCAMFISFCLHYGEVPNYLMPADSGAFTWVNRLQSMGLFRWRNEYTPKPGDLIFFDFDLSGQSDHVGIVSSLYTVDGVDMVETIEGNHTKTVEKFSYPLISLEIQGYGVMSEEIPADEQESVITTDYVSGADTYRVTMTYTADALIPDNAVLIVNEIYPGTPEYDAYVAESAGALGWEEDSVSDAKVLDISIYADGAEVQPAAPVNVEMVLVDKPAEDWNVVHFGKEEIQVLKSTAEGDAVSFATDGFSIFVFAKSKLEKTLVASDGNTYNITLTYDADKAGIPDNAELKVTEILQEVSEDFEDPDASSEYDEYLSRAEGALEENQRVTFARFFDITIMADGQEIQPASPVEVNIELANEELTAEETEDVKAVHFSSEGDVTTIDTTREDQTVTFNAEGFSVYGIVGTETITTNYITAEGDTYEVTVTYGKDAEIPDKSTLSVAEVTEAAADYESYKKQTADALNGLTDNFQYIKLLDISIINANGEKVIPAAAVDVNIRLLDKSEVSENTQIVHFGEKVEVLESSVEDDAVTFSTEGFSVFVIVDISDLPENNITQTFENDKFIITASYLEKAKISEDAILKVSEISYESDPDRYVDRIDQISGLFSESQYVCKELLNIGFWSNETNTSELLVNGSDSTEIEPADTVLIAIQFKDTAKYSEGDALSIIHFGEEGPEVAGESALDKENILSFEVKNFSDFAVVGDPAEIEYTAPTPNESNVHKEGDLDTFLSNLPYGTVLIDYDLMKMSAFNWTGLSGVSSQDSNITCTVELANGFTLGGETYGIMYDNLTLTPGESKEYRGTVATVHYTNAATLSDGTKADVVVTISNTTIKNTGLVNNFANRAFFYGNGLLPAASSNARVWGEFDFNIKIVANENTGDLNDKTFLYGMDDYDIECRNTIATTTAIDNTANFVLAIDENGDLIGRKLMRNRNDTVLGYGLIRCSEGETLGTPTGGAQEYLARYFSIPITDADEKVPLYNAQAITDGAVVTNRLYFTSDPDSEGFVPNVTETETAWPAYALYKTAVYGRYDGIFKFYLLTLEPMVSESVTLISGMTSEIYVPQYSYLFIDGYNLYPTRVDEDTLNSGYFLVANAEEGLTYTARCSGQANSHLRSSNMYYRIYSRTYEGGTISTSDTDVWGNQTAYGVHQPEGATGYKQALLAVPKNKTAVYTMTPDTFWHIWKVKISDGTEANTSGEIDLRNVTWTDGSYTHPGENGTDYTFTKDANGIISYTFTGVSEDHYITVWWEKDPPQQTVTIVKNWYDEGNARLSRPDDITVHLVRSDNGRVNPDSDETAKTELVTGTDQNITGSTQWIKNDTANQWEYTFAVTTLPEGASFKAYEDQVSDYTGDAVGNKNANAATQIGFYEDTNTYQYEVVITNTRKNGTLSFSKTDQYGSPVEGASFRLYNDADCTQPPVAVYTATSDSTGTVTFSDVPCGMYYMKETNIPTYGEGSIPYTDNRRQVYQVVIHENSEDSTITPGTVANHIFTPSEYPVSAIINTKPEGQVTITKTDENGNELTGAVFTLIKDSQQVNGSPTDPTVSSTTFNLEYGIYCLTETTAPNGYVILSNKIYFKVDDNGITLQTISVGNDGKTTYSDAKEGDYPLVSLSEDALTIYVKNTPGQELPNTGGPGTLLYTLSGIALMLGAALMYGFRLRRKGRKIN